MKITNKEIVRLMAGAGWLSVDHKPENIILKPSFQLMPESYYLHKINDDKTNEQLFEPESGNCSNFAFELLAAFGRDNSAKGVLIVKAEGIEGHHAIFFYITDDHKLVAIEPQTDSEFTRKFYAKVIIMY